jgi:serine/threonine protein kinase
MDYCEGGTLFNYFANLNLDIPSDKIKKIMKKILKGVCHLH